MKKTALSLAALGLVVSGLAGIGGYNKCKFGECSTALTGVSDLGKERVRKETQARARWAVNQPVVVARARWAVAPTD